MNLETSISQLARIGPSTVKKLHQLGIKKVEDLLFYFPTRYEDFSRIISVSQAKPNENVTIVGAIKSVKLFSTPRRKIKIVEALIEDATGSISVVWFNQPYLIKVLKRGDTIALSGKTIIEQHSVILQHPNYQILKTFDKEQFLHTGRLIPIYPETTGLSSRWFRFFIKQLSPLFEKIPETIPQWILERQGLFGIKQALQQIHFPDSLELAQRAKKRFAFEALFHLTCAAQRARLALQKERAPSIAFQQELTKKFVHSLPFKLTNCQRKAAWEILLNLSKPIPMNRLLEGDVGSGKTVVATIAALNCIAQKYQVVLMAPTEILARQHFKTISKILPQKYTLAVITGSTCQLYSKKLHDFIPLSRQKLQKRLLDGSIDIVIGTHALIAQKARETLRFKNLALVIIDEQHRFGVHQRASLLNNSSSSDHALPHFLSMTATPIPRTLALTVYGDLDISILDELPLGRKKIETKIIFQNEKISVYAFIKKEIKNGRQAFIVCPLIEESEKLQVAAATAEYERLQKAIFPTLTLGLLHGRMKSKEKEKIMKNFRENKTNVLVTTPVVEVGIDIPNATVMVIEGPERFGLAQLHQLRGRVGRSEHQSYCFLLAEEKSSRLEAFVKAENGFELAKKDLEFRGPGDLYGTRQWGVPDIAMSHIGDVKLVQTVREEALGLLKDDPSLHRYPILKKEVEDIEENLHLE